jgi:hypothetical protein
MRAAGARRVDLAFSLALFALGTALFCALAPATLELRDEGYLYVQSARSAAGEWVHRDFEDIYGPGVYALTGWLLRLSGGEILPVRYALAILRAGEVALLFAIARRFAPRREALIAALCSLALGFRVIWNLNAPYAANYTLAAALGALLLLLQGLDKNSKLVLFLAGLLAGASATFKQSLGLMLVSALGLGVVAASALESESGGARESRPKRARCIAIALGTVSLALLPVASELSPPAYLVHFLPLHLLAALLAARFAERGDFARLVSRSIPRLLAFGAGVAVVLTAVGGSYAAQGALSTLLRHTLVYPGELIHYALPVGMPTPEARWLVAAVFSGEVAALGWLRGRRIAALAAIPAAFALAHLAKRATNPFADWVASAAELAPAAFAYAGVALCTLDRAGRAPFTVRERSAFAATLLFQIFLCFQVFPRAGFNLYLMLPLVPLTLAPGLRSALGWLSADRGSLARRSAAWAALVAPLALAVAPGVAQSIREIRAPDRALALPGLRGVAPSREDAAPAEIAAFEAAVAALEQLAPGDAPLALLGNHYLLHFASPRPDLFADAAYAFHLFAWDMLPVRLRARVDPAALVARLAAHPEAIVVTADDFATANLQRALPELFTYVAQNYRAVRRIGTYRIWLRERA